VTDAALKTMHFYSAFLELGCAIMYSTLPWTAYCWLSHRGGRADVWRLRVCACRLLLPELEQETDGDARSVELVTFGALGRAN
jgi:hypothetical protein